jgi:uncharacterized membrane protein YeaQ/YmgE (transglycosylase-associated protein family)
MNFQIVATSMLAGLLAGWLAGMVMKRGGVGLAGDIGIGLGGSIVGSWIFLWVSPGPDWLAMAVVAFVGAASAIVGQRKILPGHA